MTEPTVSLGRMNRLNILREGHRGLVLDGGVHGEILLPQRELPAEVAQSGQLEVFIYSDAEERPVATLARPLAMVGEVACLKVVAATRLGAFVDWGLPKNVLVPFAEQAVTMREGQSYCVYLYRDRHHNRVVASSKLSRHLPESSSSLRAGQAVQLLICGRSKLGFKCVIDGQCLGLLHHGDVFKPLPTGESLRGYIKQIRPDGRIDVCLTPPRGGQGRDLQSQILAHIAALGGSAPIGDKTAPEEIYQLFQTSKKNFKRALSALYRDRKIVLREDGIGLPPTKHPWGNPEK